MATDASNDRKGGIVNAGIAQKRSVRRQPVLTTHKLVNKHDPFAWGTCAQKAAENALVLDEVCHMALFTLDLVELSDVGAIGVSAMRHGPSVKLFFEKRNSYDYWCSKGDQKQ